MHPTSLPLHMWIDQCNRHRILLWIHTTIVTKRQRPIICSVVDGPPEVNDLISVFEQFRDVFCREMAVDPGKGGLWSLIDVGVEDGLALLRRVFDFSGTTATDG
jgi:hypothetical protein